jgi:hypothetical protein
MAVRHSPYKSSKRVLGLLTTSRRRSGSPFWTSLARRSAGVLGLECPRIYSTDLDDLICKIITPVPFIAHDDILRS